MQTIEEVEQAFTELRKSTVKALDAVSDESLSQPVAEGFRNLGQIAWHLVTTYPEMMSRTGLAVKAVDADAPVPAEVAAIRQGYEAVSQELIEQIKSAWTDETLQEVDDMYGFKWKRALSLAILHSHEMFHLGQMTVLMRQAGLKVPGIFGPAKEEWANYGMPEPEV